jgi:hypothetical protein
MNFLDLAPHLLADETVVGMAAHLRTLKGV